MISEETRPWPGVRLTSWRAFPTGGLACLLIAAGVATASGAAKPAGRPNVLILLADDQRAVRDDRWKLIVYPKINKNQLFDLRSDPAEVHDLAGDSARASEVRRLTSLIRNWQDRLDDAPPLSSAKPQTTGFPFPGTKSTGPGTKK